MSVYLTVTNGTGTGYWPQYSYVNVRANTPPTGYRFGNWSTTGCTPNSSTASSTSVYITNSSLAWATANWVINTYTVSFSAGTGGSIGGTTTQYISHGNSGSLVSANAASGYHFVSWSDGNKNADRTPTNVTASANFTASFVADTPDITSITPSEGNDIGGTSVVIAGNRFTGATAVTFDGVAAASFTVDTDDQITAVTPAGTIGVVDVVVTTSAGSNTYTGGYEYIESGVSCSGSITPTSSLNVAGTKTFTASITPVGELSITKFAAFAIECEGSITPVGNLFIHQPRPTTLYAPWVQTMLVAPPEE